MVFDLLRTAARPVREDDDLVVAQVRNRINRTLGERPVAPSGDAQIERNDEKTVLERERDDMVNHYFASQGVTETTRERKRAGHKRVM